MPCLYFSDAPPYQLLYKLSMRFGIVSLRRHSSEPYDLGPNPSKANRPHRLLLYSLFSYPSMQNLELDQR